MFRIKLLRNLLILSLAIALFFPGYEYLFVHPAYNELLTKETENEAVRYASYMVRTLGLEDQFLTKDRLPDQLQEMLRPVSRDNRLLNLRIFSAQGEMIFSTLAEEIGTRNKNSYFREVVAAGQVYSKVVKKNQSTAEGAITEIDVVETYVPFMAGGDFGGAMEVYSDITASVSRVKQLSLHSMVTTLLMSLGFLLAIFIALYRAHLSLLERDRAEKALRVANEVLEQRVADRTSDLFIANKKLTGQIVERTETQVALKQALEDIRVDREKLDGILSSVPDGVVVTDGELHVLHMNAAAESILETSLEKALGRSLGEFCQDFNFIRNVDQHLNANYGSEMFDFEVPATDPGASRIYQVRMSRLVSDESKSPGVILLFRDVSRERDVERMKSAFLGMAAHELNTPLTTIIGYSELLTAKETAGNFDDRQQKDYLQLIHDKAMALSGLVDDLLDVSRIESGRPLNLNYREFSFPAMARDVVASYRKQYSQHQIETVLPKDAPPFCADQSRLEQVVEHLISNAIKYSPNGGTVRVDLRLLGNRYELCVTDEGIGMNEEQLAHIYDRFYRADASDTAVQGVGLGMSIVRHIVLAHHGEIHIESRLGSGTKVCITLPMAPPAADDTARQTHSPE
jgi:PAS domain S-box-containing protein